MPEILRSYGQNATNFYGLAKRLKARSDWRMGNMWAEYAFGPRTLGQLPEWRDKNNLRAPNPRNLWASVHDASYIVYSFWTPIAWYDPVYEMWVVPEVKYSQTTTTHQGKIAVALSVMDKV